MGRPDFFMKGEKRRNEKHEKIYIKHAMCLLPCFSFDETSISGDYDMGLNENKTVCERTRVKKTLK